MVYCQSYNCQHDCCDINGLCPTLSSDCYMYYKTASISVGGIVGIIIGCLVFIGLIILVVCLCRRRYRSQS